MDRLGLDCSRAARGGDGFLILGRSNPQIPEGVKGASDNLYRLLA